MKILKRLAVAAALGLAVGAMALGAPASAQDGVLPASDWRPLDTSGPGFTQGASVHSRILGPTTIHLEADDADPDSKGTSVETLDLDLPIQAQQEISFEFELLDGATCVGGAPRVFVEIDGVYVNSWDQLQPTGEQCGLGGLVTFVGTANGRIGAAGVVFDSGAGGAIRVSNLTVNGQLVLFAAPPALCDVPGLGDLLASDEKCEKPQPTPSVEPTTEPTVDPSTGPGASDDEDLDPVAADGLPVTGSPLPLLIGGAAVLLAVGGGLFLAARRRRINFTA